MPRLNAWIRFPCKPWPPPQDLPSCGLHHGEGRQRRGSHRSRDARRARAFLLGGRRHGASADGPRAGRRRASAGQRWRFQAGVNAQGGGCGQDANHLHSQEPFLPHADGSCLLVRSHLPGRSSMVVGLDGSPGRSSVFHQGRSWARVIGRDWSTGSDLLRCSCALVVLELQMHRQDQLISKNWLAIK